MGTAKRSEAAQPSLEDPFDGGSDQCESACFKIYPLCYSTSVIMSDMPRITNARYTVETSSRQRQRQDLESD